MGQGMSALSLAEKAALWAERVKSAQGEAPTQLAHVQPEPAAPAALLTTAAAIPSGAPALISPPPAVAKPKATQSKPRNQAGRPKKRASTEAREAARGPRARAA